MVGDISSDVRIILTTTFKEIKQFKNLKGEVLVVEPIVNSIVAGLEQITTDPDDTTCEYLLPLAKKAATLCIMPETMYGTM